MEYKVIPFVATANHQNQNSANIAKQLEDLIRVQASQGWNYIRLENVSTHIQPIKGCFGNTVQKGYLTSYQIVVFSKA